MQPKDIKQIKTAEQARQFAIDWQNWQTEQEFGWYDVAVWTDAFAKLGKRFGLEQEFKENGIL